MGFGPGASVWPTWKIRQKAGEVEVASLSLSVSDLWQVTGPEAAVATLEPTADALRDADAAVEMPTVLGRETVTARAHQILGCQPAGR